MSGDVQPRKRKDKKRKKDEVSVEEPRGTAAALGEGDVFLHSYHEHGTGGHWCAKVIFFSLLAVLITLIGLIILENRGLSELEANAVESRYSGVLEGWLEDAPDDDHHDEHTLELKHHIDEVAEQDIDDDIDEPNELYYEDDEEDNEHDEEDKELDEDDEEDNEGDDENEASDENNEEPDDLDNTYNELEDENDDYIEHVNKNGEFSEEDKDNNDIDEEDNGYYSEHDRNNEDSFEDEAEHLGNYIKYNNYDQVRGIQDEYQNEENLIDEYSRNDIDNNGIDNSDGEEEDKAYLNEYTSHELTDDKNKESQEDNENTEEEDDHDDDDDDEGEETEVERIEREASDEEPISIELPALPETDGDDDDNDEDENKNKDLHKSNEVQILGGDDDNEDDDFLDNDDVPPVVERITAPAGKPFHEVEDEDSTEVSPIDTLADEEEYEKRQEELRREEEQVSHLWLKLGVGGALLLATHAVLRRAAASRDTSTDAVDDEEETAREETPLSDRRMTLLPEEQTSSALPKNLQHERVPTIVQDRIVKQIPSIIESAPTPKQLSLQEDVEDDEGIAYAVEEHKELYSEEEIEEEEIIEERKEIPIQNASPAQDKQEEEEDVPDDVEIIEDEEIEEEVEEDEEEEISDVDDAELLSRLEAKYGRLPEPERPGQKHKDGGNSVDELWPGEPSDPFWRQELDSAERDLRQGSWEGAVKRASAPELVRSARARWIVAKAYDEMAEARRDNRLLSQAITAYLDLLKMNEQLSDKKLLEITARTLERIQFRGTYLSAEPVYRLLIRRFPKEPAYRNNLTISFLMANRADLAAEVLKETLVNWPNDQVALAHYAFVLKTHYNRLEEAVQLFYKALEYDSGPANEPRFYYHLGDALLLLGRYAEAHEVHKRGAALGHFLSPSQRSLYNVARLKSRPWWNVEETPYEDLARALEKHWKEILSEGEKARALYEEEKEGLRERGDWSQWDLFVRGREVGGRCKRAPRTCEIVRTARCRRGQVKFSLMKPGTHVRPHVGPTNCRLRMHLALSNTKDTYIRVDKEIRQWEVGKTLLFDDSFEHEVWHNGTAPRLVLIVDVWHPDLTPHEQATMPAI